jgi:hypothetical protein
MRRSPTELGFTTKTQSSQRNKRKKEKPGGFSSIGFLSVLCAFVVNPNSRCFGVMLSPVHYRRRTPRPVSYYALFKWWLLLSQHPGCLRNPTSFRTEHDLGTLAGDLGCFPLDDEAYPPPSSCRCCLMAFGVWFGRVAG